MGIVEFFTGKSKANYGFSEKDRELSIERRRRAKELEDLRQTNLLDEEKERHETKMYELKISKLEKQMEYEDLLDDGTDEPIATPGISEEGQLFMQLMNKIPALQSRPAQGVPPQSPPPLQPSPVVSDEQLQAMWAQVPITAKAMIPKCNDDQIKEFILAHMIPNADAETLNRAVKLARQSA